ncbi:DUF255 domain-containing protein, partial [Streptomyces sp. LHD-70]|uniref:DUF255 domain-containing protein n=1 Tax=Streptomyces sp. LHD-70 TaxID=3072140 RepID=UPI00280D755C
DTLKGQLSLEQHGGRTPAGVFARTGQRLLALATAIWHNWTSPCLLQHADNPVDWWTREPGPFVEGRRRGVPVLLSVGYSSCHWCQ